MLLLAFYGNRCKSKLKHALHSPMPTSRGDLLKRVTYKVELPTRILLRIRRCEHRNSSHFYTKRRCKPTISCYVLKTLTIASSGQDIDSINFLPCFKNSVFGLITVDELSEPVYLSIGHSVNIRCIHLHPR